MNEKTIQHQEFFEKMQKKIIEESTEETNASIAETFAKQWYTTKGMIDLIGKWYGKYIAKDISVFVRYCRGWEGGIDGIKILHTLIHNGFGEQVARHMNCLDHIMVPSEQRKELFESLIESEQGNFLLKHIQLYQSEHQSIVDMLLETESEYWDFEQDGSYEVHYDAGQSPLIIEYWDKFIWIDQAKTLQYLIENTQFEALEIYLNLKWVNRIKCINKIFRKWWFVLIEWWYRDSIEKILTEDERKKIWYAILKDNKNNQETHQRMFKYRHKFCLTLEEIEQLSG